MIKDYRIYEFSKKEKLICFLEGMLLNGIISLLFYNSFYAMLPGMIFVFFYFKEKKRMMTRKRAIQMKLELKEFLNALIAALQTGRSLENGFLEATKDAAGYAGKHTELQLEMKQICAKVSVGEPLEKMVAEFSARSHMEELEYFSEVLSIAKRSGGNIIGIMKNTIRMIREKMEVMEEIETTITEKQFEFQIMSVIPMIIILYLRISAGSLIKSLYGNITGASVMTVCLLIYGGCYLYGKRLLEIEH
jgi:tight adherence protein B